MSDWLADAACRGMDVDVFAPWSTSLSPAQQRPWYAEPAKAICARCSVRAECLADAMATGDSDTVRGGLTPAERLDITTTGRRRGRDPHSGHLVCPKCGERFTSPQGLGGHLRAHGIEAVCGTSGGYSRHRRRGEDPCGACAAAAQAYQAAYRARRKGDA